MYPYFELLVLVDVHFHASASPDGLLKILYVTLLHQQMRHPGAPRSVTSTLSSTPSTAAVQEADIGGITLALQTLGSFNFGGVYCTRYMQCIRACV